MIRAIIIDDEQHGRQALLRALEANCPEVSVLAACETPEAGIARIKELQPNLVFLDIQMPNMSGFDVLQALTPVRFKVIFVTSFEQYAIRAIKFSALDYLLKPVDMDDLVHAVQRAKEHLHNGEGAQRIESVLNNIHHRTGKIDRLAVPTLQGIDFYKTDEIIYCEADGHYTSLHLPGGRIEVVSKSLKDFENLLSESGFYRSHHSALVNMTHIQKYIRGDGGYVVLTDGHSVPVSRRRKDAFIRLLDKI